MTGTDAVQLSAKSPRSQRLCGCCYEAKSSIAEAPSTLSTQRKQTASPVNLKSLT